MRILIVDDAKETRESLHNIIKIKLDNRYEIAEAEDGLEALGLVESFKPDIVLTDVLMPKMDGIRFTSILKSQSETKHIFVAAITGLSGEEQIEKIYASGVDFYISKPFQLDDIIARLQVITSLITQRGAIPKERPNVVYNCFKDEFIKHYFTTFSITQEDDIFLIFDYFSKQNIKYNSILLKDFMVTLVKTYRKMDEKNRLFDLIIEESDSYIYVTVQDDIFIEAIEQLVDKQSSLLEYKKSNDALSFRVDILSSIDNRKENKLKKERYQNELMSATELMIIISEDVNEFISELRVELLSYRSFCNDNNTYNDSLHLIIVNLFDQYIRLFKKIPGFDRVSIALHSVILIIEEKKYKIFDKANNIDMLRHLELLNVIIEGWIMEVITNQLSRDVHNHDHEIVKYCSLLEKDFS